MESKQRLAGGMSIAAVGVTALAFVPGLRDVSVLFWTIGFVMFGSAFAIAIAGTRRRARRLMLSGTAFVACVAAGIAVTQGITTAANASEPTRSNATTGRTVTADPALTTLELAAELAPTTSSEHDRAVSAARSVEYAPRSGLLPVWAEAQTYEYEGATLVSVPLGGTDVPEMSKVSFLTVENTTTVTEMATEMRSADVVHFGMWTNGAETHNVDLDRHGLQEQSDVGTFGLNWTKLNNCLNSIGISWAIIAVLGVACGAACATLVLCGPCLAAAGGFTTGTIAKCVSLAWA